MSAIGRFTKSSDGSYTGHLTMLSNYNSIRIIPRKNCDNKTNFLVKLGDINIGFANQVCGKNSHVNHLNVEIFLPEENDTPLHTKLYHFPKYGNNRDYVLVWSLAT